MKSFLAVVAIATVLTTPLQAEAQKFTTYELESSKLHIYETGDVMNDVSFIIEGKKSLVVMEQPLFKDNIEEFAKYVESLGKPIDKVFANYHVGGLSPYSERKVVMPTTMIEFSNSPMSKGMISKFEGMFGDKADLLPFGRVKGIAIPSTQKWAGVEFELTNGVKSDFPAASVLIDNTAFYTHFAPMSGSHMSKMVIRSADAIDFNLAELRKIEASGAKYIIGSHGAPSTMEDVKFQIDYLTTLKSIYESSPDSDTFGQRLLSTLPALEGYLNIREVAKNLYPNEERCEEKEAVRARMQDYLDMISTQDMTIAKGLWAEKESITLINPRKQLFGYDEITTFIKGFSASGAKLSSISEVINVSGNMGYVQLYWLFERNNPDGGKSLGRGRESLLFEKINDEWRLVHVHYSPLPAQ